MGWPIEQISAGESTKLLTRVYMIVSHLADSIAAQMPSLVRQVLLQRLSVEIHQVGHIEGNIDAKRDVVG